MNRLTQFGAVVEDFLGKFWVLLVPIVVTFLAFEVMQETTPAQRSDIPEAFATAFYDEADLGAIALRGANSSVGRLPGRLDEPAGKGSDTFSPRFYLEYPVPALALFHLAYLPEQISLPSEVGDAFHVLVARHVPVDEEERLLWGAFRRATRRLILMMLAATLVLILLLRAGYEPGMTGPLWLLALPSAVYFAINRFDILPTTAVALGLYCLGRRRFSGSGFCFALGVLLKVFPILFVPVVLRYLGPTRAGVRFLATFLTTIVLGILASMLWTDREATLAPYLLQFGRTPETGWTFYGSIFPWSLAHAGVLRLGILATVCGLVLIHRPRDLDGVLRRCALLAIVFILLAVFWSPQWYLWLLPFVVPLARENRRLLVIAAITDLVAYYSFVILFRNPEVIHDSVETCEAGRSLFVIVRFLCWVFLALAILFPPRRRDPKKVFLERISERLSQFQQVAATRATPRGLRLLQLEATESPRFQDSAAYLPCLARYEPLPDSELADVPQAREPRPVVIIFRWNGKEWTTDGRVIFNLSVDEVIARVVRTTA